jgi:hypothetical protein
MQTRFTGRDNGLENHMDFIMHFLLVHENANGAIRISECVGVAATTCLAGFPFTALPGLFQEISLALLPT